MKRFTFIVLFLQLTAYSYAAFDFNMNCRKAYTEILCLRFNTAEKLLANENAVNPTNQVPALFYNYIDFLKVMLGEEEKDFDKMRNNFEPRLQKLASGNNISPWFLYSQAMLYLQNGFAKVKFEQYISAGLDINRAYRLLEENRRKFPDFACNNIGLGMLHALIGTVPPQYNWAVRSLNFEGSVLQGTKELKLAMQAISKNKEFAFMEFEPIFLLSFSYLNLSPNQAAAYKLAEYIPQSQYATIIHQSPLITYMLVKINAQAGNNDKVIKLITELKHSEGQYKFHYLNYLLGVAKMNRLDKDAHYVLLDFVAGFRGKNYIKSAYMYLSWYYYLNQNVAMFHAYKARIPLRGNSQVDNDREAAKFASRTIDPNITLLKARLLFDGGYYGRAILLLENFVSAGKTEQLEMIYRKARIYDKWGKTELAIPLYQQTIVTGERLPYYFAANAALNLALIYEKEGDKDAAIANFRKVLSMKFDEYHFSITNKAEAGINRMNKK